MTRRKMRAISAQHNDFHVVILCRQIKGIIQFVKHALVLGVADVHAIQRDSGNLIGHFIDNGRKL